MCVCIYINVMTKVKNGNIYYKIEKHEDRRHYILSLCIFFLTLCIFFDTMYLRHYKLPEPNSAN